MYPCVSRMWKTTKEHACGQGLEGKTLEGLRVICMLAMEMAHAISNFYSHSPKIDCFVWRLQFSAAEIWALWRHDALTLKGHRRFASRVETELQSGARVKLIPVSVCPVWVSENRSGQLLIAYSKYTGTYINTLSKSGSGLSQFSSLTPLNR